MSLNSEEKTSGSGGGGAGGVGHALQAPRLLLQGGYVCAAWRPNMDVFLQRAGAEGVHRKPMSSADWIARSDMVAKCVTGACGRLSRQWRRM